MVEEGWLKMLRERKFRELKTADEEKGLLENPFQNQHVMSRIGLLIFFHGGKMQGWTNKHLTNKQGSTWNATKSKV